MINPLRFLKKCVTDWSAATKSARLFGRKLYGQWYWFFNPHSALAYRFPTGHILQLEPNHSFTHCFWPGVEQYEPDVQAALKYLLRPGYTFIDCGANIGYFSLFAAGLVGREGHIIAIEANPLTYELLQRNLNANHCGQAIHCALTSSEEELELYMPDRGDVYSSLRQRCSGSQDGYRTFKVFGRTLDDVVQELAPTSVDVVKIDIEGGELDVLKSSTNLLSTFRPIFIMEYGTNTWPNFGATPEALKKVLSEYDYIIRKFSLQYKQLKPITDEIWSTSYTNLILLPSEQCERFI